MDTTEITIPESYHGLAEAQDIWLANKLTFMDAFQDAVPCWQDREPYPMTDQWRYEISRGLTKLSYSQWIQEVKDSRE